MKSSAFNELAAREIYLNPGDIRCGFKQEVFGTLLGSCVSITLWHPQRHFGSICHFVLPDTSFTPDSLGKYGAFAFEQQKKDLIRHSVNLSQCTAKIFGGGRMLTNSSIQDIGLKNITKARQLLNDSGLSIAAESVGGEGYRRLYFDVSSGEVWIKFDWIDEEQEDKIL